MITGDLNNCFLLTMILMSVPLRTPVAVASADSVVCVQSGVSTLTPSASSAASRGRCWSHVSASSTRTQRPRHSYRSSSWSSLDGMTSYAASTSNRYVTTVLSLIFCPCSNYSKGVSVDYVASFMTFLMCMQIMMPFPIELEWCVRVPLQIKNDYSWRCLWTNALLACCQGLASAGLTEANQCAREQAWPPTDLPCVGPSGTYLLPVSVLIQWYPVMLNYILVTPSNHRGNLIY